MMARRVQGLHTPTTTTTLVAQWPSIGPLEQILQSLYILNGTPEDLHFGQPLFWICTCPLLQLLKCFIYLKSTKML